MRHPRDGSRGVVEHLQALLFDLLRTLLLVDSRQRRGYPCPAVGRASTAMMLVRPKGQARSYLVYMNRCCYASGIFLPERHNWCWTLAPTKQKRRAVHPTKQGKIHVKFDYFSSILIPDCTQMRKSYLTQLVLDFVSAIKKQANQPLSTGWNTCQNRSISRGHLIPSGAFIF